MNKHKFAQCIAVIITFVLITWTRLWLLFPMFWLRTSEFYSMVSTILAVAVEINLFWMVFRQFFQSKKRIILLEIFSILLSMGGMVYFVFGTFDIGTGVFPPVGFGM